MYPPLTVGIWTLLWSRFFILTEFSNNCITKVEELSDTWVMKMNKKNIYIGMSLHKEWVNVFDGPPSHLRFLI